MTKSGIIHKGWVWQSIALAAIGLYIIVFTAFTIERHNTFNSAAYDLGIYDNILWKMSRGDLLGFLRPGFVGGAHIDLILILLVPLRWVWPDVRGLLFIQSFALGIAGLAVYRIAVRAWQRPWAGAFFTVMYLLYVPVGWVNKFDFHPIALAAPLLYFAFDAGEARRYHRTSGLLFLAMLCKEEMGLVVASMGLFFFLKERWRAGLAWTVIGILWFAAGFVAINLLGVADVNRYSWLFQGTLGDRIAFFFQDIQHRLLFILELLIPFFFTPLLCLQVLAVALP